MPRIAQSRRWQRRLLRLRHVPVLGQLVLRYLATQLGPLYGALPLASLLEEGYLSPFARINHPDVRIGRHSFIGDGVTVYADNRGGFVELGERVHLHERNTLQCGDGANIHIGSGAHIQPGGQFSAYMHDIYIGCDVEIAPGCAFYSYNHEMAAERPIREQALISKGPIRVGDEAWLGYGVVVLDGVTIGKGAVIAAGAVVTTDIEEYAIAGGIPAKQIGSRSH